MTPGEVILLSVAGGAAAALAPLLILTYYAREVSIVAWAGALNSFITGFIFTLLALQWGFFYARFTYLLALALLALSLVYSYWGIFRGRWLMYLFAAAAWIYVIILAVVARALGLGDPFII
ncbi:MAG: hypothetical protein ACK4SY_09835 [Pyrobaculum sp.]